MGMRILAATDPAVILSRSSVRSPIPRMRTPKNAPSAIAAADIWRARSKRGCGTDSVASVGRCSRMSACACLTRRRNIASGARRTFLHALDFSSLLKSERSQTIQSATCVERRRDASDCGSLTRMKQVPREESSGSQHARVPYRRCPLDALAIRR